jgi:predicted component of type VI protein secretion system
MSPVFIVLVLVAVAVGVFFMMKSKEDAPTPSAPPEPKTPALKTNWLVQKTAEGEQTVWHIGERRVTAGRGPTNFVQITDARASRKQCQFSPEDGKLVLVDMSSSNGTFVNGTVVRKKVLSDGDVIKLANTEFIYYRTGDFEGNEGFGRKDAGKSSLRTTKVHRDLGKAAKADMMLEAMEGDVEKAAAAMEISVDEFKELIA